MVKVTLVTWPPIVLCAVTELTALLTVAIVNELAGAKGLAVFNSPAAKLIRCGPPAASGAVAVMHTILSAVAFIVHWPARVAVPEEDGVRVPVGFNFSLK